MEDYVEADLLRKNDIPRATHCCKIVMGRCQSIAQIITLITLSWKDKMRPNFVNTLIIVVSSTA